MLGLAVDHDTVVSLIEAVGATVIADQDQLSITAPSWRPDLRDPYDYVEEVGRLIGFDQIPPVVPQAPVGRGLTRSQRARRAVTVALATSGFVEVLSFPFTSVDELDRMGIAADDERRRLNKIINPLSETTPVPAHLTAARAVRSRAAQPQPGQRRSGPVRDRISVLRRRIRRCPRPARR